MPVPPETEKLADRVLAAAWLLELAGFLVFAGPRGMIPGQERYAICLIAPAVLLAARAAAVWWAGAGRMKTPAAVLACVLAWLALADFQRHYFAFIERTGGQAHSTFRTAAVEPKLAALDYVLQRRTAGVAWIAADSWWSEWPLKYFALGNRDVRIVAFRDAAAEPEFVKAANDGRAWGVEFCDATAEQERLDPRFQRPGEAARILDFGGRPVLAVFRLSYKK